MNIQMYTKVYLCLTNSQTNLTNIQFTEIEEKEDIGKQFTDTKEKEDIGKAKKKIA